MEEKQLLKSWNYVFKSCSLSHQLSKMGKTLWTKEWVRMQQLPKTELHYTIFLSFFKILAQLAGASRLHCLPTLNQLCVGVRPHLPALRVFLSQWPRPFLLLPAPPRNIPWASRAQLLLPWGSRCVYCYLYNSNKGCSVHKSTNSPGTWTHQTRQIIQGSVLIFNENLSTSQS